MPAPPETMLPLLALDTATESITLGLQVGDRSQGGAWTRQAPGGAAASAQLVPLIHDLLREAGVPMRAVRAVAFGQGPGAFTGLRTACSVAQGLGFGLGVPLLPLCSLMLVAEDARVQGSALHDVAVAMDARMDEVYAGRYRWLPERGSWAVLDAPALYTLPALAAAWGSLPPQQLAGSALAAFGERLPLPAAWPRQPQEHDRPAALLRLALQAAATQPGIDAAAALPLYLRDKVALTTREREAARAATATP
jgi:tRNA threonylcarbamoyladenosine biosynthesis protein TsaB